MDNGARQECRSCGAHTLRSYCGNCGSHDLKAVRERPGGVGWPRSLRRVLRSLPPLNGPRRNV